MEQLEEEEDEEGEEMVDGEDDDENLLLNVDQLNDEQKQMLMAYLQ